jgi:hypothetical protein
MGSGTWDSGAYTAATTARRASGIDDFDYTNKVRLGAVSGIHSSLDPLSMKNPDSSKYRFPLRESRDNDEHPDSIPIAMIFDVTGSMRNIPMVLQQKLSRLMDVVIDKAGIPDPQVLVGAVGDSTCDRYPLQVGQFESSNLFDEQLRNIILEGGGGGQVMESYALAYRFAADHTATDAFEKRGKKGYLFTMGDEAPWPTVTAADVSRLFGVEAAEDETVESLIARASERWEIFHLFSLDGSYRNHVKIHEQWRDLLGERLIMVEDSSLVCEIIAGIVHMMETAYDVDRVVGDIGLSGASATAVKNALVPVGTSSLVAKRAARSSGALKKGGAARGGVSRI